MEIPFVMDSFEIASEQLNRSSSTEFLLKPIDMLPEIELFIIIPSSKNLHASHITIISETGDLWGSLFKKTDDLWGSLFKKNGPPFRAGRIHQRIISRFCSC